ncbi:3'-5' exonuclease [Rufibacter immobilis]|uniref:3'-5' exonuclease n=1 Tax=Rufibacter immobilis TaxID=1348778 RepID=UPI0035E819CE
MKDYLLFIDIESSGLPLRWDLPYSEDQNWPHTVQVAWFVYTQAGQEIKHEDHYIRPDDFEVSASSIEIHHLTPEFLQAHGKSREEVLLRLQKDLREFQPMVVGHFMEFDYHVLSADYYRSGLPSPFEGLDTFCTMRASGELVRFSPRKYLRLGELYSHLFHKTLENQHNAVVDARAAAECYFELRQRHLITAASVAGQQRQSNKIRQETFAKPRRLKWLLWGLGLLLILLLLFYWL